MKNAMTTTFSRRTVLSRLLLAAAVAPVVGLTRADDVDASKKTKKKIQRVVEVHKKVCANVGGTAEVDERPGGTSVTCTGAEGGDYTCTISSKKERCHMNLTHNPAPDAGGGGAVPPGDVGNEDPTDGDGNNAGGGADVPPGGGVG